MGHAESIDERTKVVYCRTTKRFVCAEDKATKRRAWYFKISRQTAPSSAIFDCMVGGKSSPQHLKDTTFVEYFGYLNELSRDTVNWYTRACPDLSRLWDELFLDAKDPEPPKDDKDDAEDQKTMQEEECRADPLEFLRHSKGDVPDHVLPIIRAEFEAIWELELPMKELEAICLQMRAFKTSEYENTRLFWTWCQGSRTRTKKREKKDEKKDKKKDEKKDEKKRSTMATDLQNQIKELETQLAAAEAQHVSIIASVEEAESKEHTLKNESAAVEQKNKKVHEELNVMTKTEEKVRASYEQIDMKDYVKLCKLKTHMERSAAFIEKEIEDGTIKNKDHVRALIDELRQLWENGNGHEAGPPKDIHDAVMSKLDKIEKDIANRGVNLPIRLGHP
ncbi:hypothetical protein HDK64DRAFT_255886 [Phyllosticta capitalensis]